MIMITVMMMIIIIIMMIIIMIIMIRPKKRNCLFPVTVKKKTGYVGRKKKFICIIFLVKNVCFMHVFL